MRILLTFLLILSLVPAYGQGTWTQLSSYPGAGRHHICSFVLGDSAYLVTGSGSNAFLKYDIHNDTWEQLPNFPGGGRNFAIGFAVNGKGYVSCGFDGNNSLMDMWEYDPAMGSWTEKTAGPAVGRVHPAFAVVGDKVYIGQGQMDGSWADIADWYEYNTVTDTWTQKTSFMSARHHGCAATVGNTIYVGTGHHQNTMFNDWYAYDATNDSWTTKADFTGDGRSAGNAVTRAGKVYYFAGEDEIDFDRFDDFREYDPVSDSWTTLEQFPAGGRWAPFMFVHNDTIYVGAGEDLVYTGRNDLWRYDFPLTADLEEISSESISVYPNPAGNWLKIQGILPRERVSILNELGEVVIPEQLIQGKIDVSSLSAGIYFLRLSQAAKVIKISVQ